jgi:hypothetical protein
MLWRSLEERSLGSFRFRKSVRIMPGVRVNLSKSGVSTSIGAKGATVNVSKKGVRTTVGVPGSGLSYSHLSKAKRASSAASRPAARQTAPTSASDTLTTAVVWAAISAVTIAFLYSPSPTFIRVGLMCLGAFSALLLILALIAKRQEGAVNRELALDDVRYAAPAPQPLAPDVRPVDRVWEWFRNEIEDFSPQARETAIALRTTNNARGLDAFCRQQGAKGGQS